MSNSVYTQLLRNFLCVVKALLPASSFLLRPLFSLAPAPLNEVNGLEYAIAITQLGAVVFNIVACYTDMIQGYREYLRSCKSLVALDKLSIHGGTVGSGEYTVLKHALQSDLKVGNVRFWIGVCEFFIGCAFTFLMANSLHLRSPSHPWPLIHAVTVMEMCMIYILWIMWEAVIKQMSKGVKLSELAVRLKQAQGTKLSTQKVLEIASDCGYLDNLMEAYMLSEPGYTPVYRRSTILIDGLREDLKLIHNNMDDSGNGSPIMVNDPSTIVDSNPTFTHKRKKQPVHSGIIVSDLQAKATICYVEAVIDSFLFILNFIAGYGYFMGVLACYHPQPIEGSFVDALLLGFTSVDADWYGNFMGDLAWAIEPLVIIFRTQIISLFAKVSLFSVLSFYCL